MVRPPRDVGAAVRAYARDHGATLNDVVVGMIAAYLGRSIMGDYARLVTETKLADLRVPGADALEAAEFRRVLARLKAGALPEPVRSIVMSARTESRSRPPRRGPSRQTRSRLEAVQARRLARERPMAMLGIWPDAPSAVLMAAVATAAARGLGGRRGQP